MNRPDGIVIFGFIEENETKKEIKDIFSTTIRKDRPQSLEVLRNTYWLLRSSGCTIFIATRRSFFVYINII